MKKVTSVVVPFSCFGRRCPELCRRADEGKLDAVYAPHPSPLPERERGAAGFTLIESLVIVSIIAIFAALSLAALPAARAHQQLVADTQLINSLLLDSKQRAINQVRPEDCLRDTSNPESKARAACSDVGIRISGNVIRQFADTNESHGWNGNDYEIVKHTLSTRPSGASTVLFISKPPSVITYRQGSGDGPGRPMEPASTATITLRASNGTTRTLTIRPFGTVDIQTP